jgi:UDP-N-acetylglucosamine diphosphorylase/glucosamine-1-phosphate N-acetyltransferase
MVIVLVEDPGWMALRPLTWLRPAASLRLGAWTILERWERGLEGEARLLCRPEIAALSTKGLSSPLSRDDERLWVRDRWLPDTTVLASVRDAPTPSAFANGTTIWGVKTRATPEARLAPGGEAFWDDLARGAAVRRIEAPSAITELSDCLTAHESFLPSDLEALLLELPQPRSQQQTGIGDGFAYEAGRVRVGEGARIDHGAVLDAREGPIVLGARTVVHPHTWIRGPFLCGEECLLLGGKIGGGSAFGAGCRARGEIESSIFLGQVNKAHEGFVGHSILGEWVNLGALTTTSDLKNNYGRVELRADGRRVDTGLRKVGSFLGDHVKTRIGAMLNTGSVVGIGTNLFGEDGLFPKWVPDFAWGTGEQAGVHDWDRFVATAETVLGRRGRELSGPMRVALRSAFEASRGDRDAFLRGPV